MGQNKKKQRVMIQGRLTKLLRWMVLASVFYFLPVQAKIWPLSDVIFKESTSSNISRFIYVEQGKAFFGVVLQGKVQIPRGVKTVVSISVDGKLMPSVLVDHESTFRFTLPAMKEGFHRIEFKSSAPVFVPIPQEEVACLPTQSVPLALKNLQLKYIPKRIRFPKVSALPDGLYNQSYPLNRPWKIGVIFRPLNHESQSAAAQLAMLFSATSGVEFTTDAAESDAFIVFLKKDGIYKGANISLKETRFPSSLCFRKGLGKQCKLPVLKISYSTPELLNSAILALLNVDYRKELEMANVEIPIEVEEPSWGMLFDPIKLKDYGIGNFRLFGNDVKNFPLSLPMYWQITGPVKGYLQLKVQNNLPNESALKVWVDDQLVSTVGLSKLEGDLMENRVDLLGQYTAEKSSFNMQFQTFTPLSGLCSLNDTDRVWVDAQESEITFPHRQKLGIMQYMPALVANPVIAIQSSLTQIEAAIAIGQVQRRVTGNKPLPVQLISLNDPSADKAPVTVRVDMKAFEQFVSKHQPKVNPIYSRQAVWLHVDEKGRLQIIARNSLALHQLKSVWKKAVAEFDDGVLDVLLNTQSGDWVVINRLPASPVVPQSRLTNSQFGWGVVLTFIIFILVLSLILWRYKKFKQGSKT